MRNLVSNVQLQRAQASETLPRPELTRSAFLRYANTSPTRKRGNISEDFPIPRLRVGLVLQRFVFFNFHLFC